VFQALRIVANAELDALERALPQVPRLLRPGARVAVISFHSLEDRIVKRFFRSAAQAGDMIVVTKKPLRPTAEEVARNPRAQSARLRVAERPGATRVT
jgi:16S rRNA (cytosine1402-N4)-methyltransferase